MPARACWPAAAVAPCWFACCFACVSAVRACRITASETLVSRPLDAQPLRSSSFPHFTNNRLLLLLVILLLLLPSLHPHVVFCFLFCVFSLLHCCLSPPSLVCETGRPTIDDTRPNRSASHMGICATRTRRANDFPLALAAAAAVRASGDFFFLSPVGPFAVNGRECFAR